MDFKGFNVLPAEGRLVESAEQKAVGETLEAAKVLGCIPPASEVLVEVGRRVPAGSTLAAAHDEWNESYFPSLETPPELPRQPLDINTPAGLVHVTVSAIKKRTPGMDSHFGFEGYFLSVLLSPGEHAIWDARGEGAT